MAFGQGQLAMNETNTKANKAVVQRYIDEIQNGHSLKAIDDVFSEGFVDHTASGGGVFVGGVEGLKQGYATFLKAFPDLHATVEEMIAEGDKVVAYKTLKGTHSHDWLGIPATGKRIEFKIISIYQIKNDKITEFWGLQDEMTLRQQLTGQ